MKNTAIQSAINALVNAVQALECTASGTVSWEERYYQERADHNANLATVQAQLDLKTKAADRLGKLHDELTATLAARDDALKGWIAVADERARRLSSLQDDMQGMVSVLNDERAQSTAKIKALETEMTDLNRALRSADNVASALLDQLSAMRTRSLIAEQKLENMDEDLRGAVFARDDLTNQLAETRKLVVAQRVVINDMKAQ